MTQSKDFGFGEDEAMLRDSARKFFEDNCSADKIHKQVAHDYHIERDIECIWDQSLWRQIGELGWTAVCVPESAGGVGMGVVAAVALAEEAGRTAFPSPLISTFNATFVLRECTSDNAIAALTDIAGGKAATLAITDRAGSWEPSDTDVSVSDGKLSGTAWFVQDAKKAEMLVVSARGESGVGLYRVDPSAAGVDIEADAIIDLTRDQGHIRFDNAEAVALAPPGEGDVALSRAMPAMLCMVSA
ncbi:MAG TPA: acyl-CoA dehydrogenase family protein, partial [Pseudomonadales bacterium]|nr:acyl-CoA dehydrogenase family protein [Pseudomonadales bacterium]